MFMTCSVFWPTIDNTMLSNPATGVRSGLLYIVCPEVLAGFQTADCNSLGSGDLAYVWLVAGMSATKASWP